MSNTHKIIKNLDDSYTVYDSASDSYIRVSAYTVDSYTVDPYTSAYSVDCVEHTLQTTHTIDPATST